jgi:aminopeptidase N
VQARFNFSISSLPGIPALFNTAAVATKPSDVAAPGQGPEHVLTRFVMTPPMATYLLGIVVGDLAKVEGVYRRPGGGEVAVRVWGRAGQTQSLTLARDVAISALRGTCLQLVEQACITVLGHMGRAPH